MALYKPGKKHLDEVKLIIITEATWNILAEPNGHIKE